jgi:hypothetical protein
LLQAQLAAIKQQEEKDKQQQLEAREVSKQERDAAAMALWLQKYGKPKQPKKPRAPCPRKQQPADAPSGSAAAGGVAAAAAAVGALNDDELMGLLSGAGSSKGKAGAAAAAAAPAKPKGIQIKAVFKPVVAKPAQQQQQQTAAEEEQPGTPSTQVSGMHVAPLPLIRRLDSNKLPCAFS